MELKSKHVTEAKKTKGQPKSICRAEVLQARCFVARTATVILRKKKHFDAWLIGQIQSDELMEQHKPRNLNQHR
jgi:hypothetical protein